jgi:hypothetical protein
MIHTKAMLVQLTISQWTGRKKDKKITQATNRHYGADNNAGFYSKALIPKEATKELNQIVSEARTFHYENTLPWKDNGERLLPTKNYLDYTGKMQEFANRFDTQVKAFLAIYPDLINQACETLNQMFDPADYPTIQKLESRFAFSTQINPVPCGEDFRVDLATEEVNRIRQQIEGQLQKAQADAMASLWQRLYEVVDKMAYRLSDEKAIFRDSLVGNVKDLVDLLPKLNIADDPALERLGEEIKQTLCATPPIVLRKVPAIREQTADHANNILTKMDHYMGTPLHMEAAA